MLGTHLVGDDGVLIAATAYTEVIVQPLQYGTNAKVDEFLAAMGAQVVAVDRAAIAVHLDRAAGEQFTVVGQCDLDPGESLAAVPTLIASGG